MLGFVCVLKQMNTIDKTLKWKSMQVATRRGKCEVVYISTRDIFLNRFRPPFLCIKNGGPTFRLRLQLI